MGNDSKPPKKKNWLLITFVVILIVFVVLFSFAKNISDRNTEKRKAEMANAMATIYAPKTPRPGPTRTPRPKSNSGSSSSLSSNSGSSYSRTLSTSDPEFVDVWICAKDLVQSNLKAPKTAKFPSQYDIMITSLGGSDYRILGYVDSQNGFGAMIRSNFIATLTLTSSGYKNGYVSFY